MANDALEKVRRSPAIPMLYRYHDRDYHLTHLRGLSLTFRPTCMGSVDGVIALYILTCIQCSHQCGDNKRTPAKANFDAVEQSCRISLGLRITRAMSDMANLGKGDEVSIEVTEEGLLVSRKKPVKRFRLPYSEADLLAGMTRHTAHADELPSLLTHEVGG